MKTNRILSVALTLVLSMGIVSMANAQQEGKRVTVFISVLLFAGCTSIGPPTVDRDRFEVDFYTLTAALPF